MFLQRIMGQGSSQVARPLEDGGNETDQSINNIPHVEATSKSSSKSPNSSEMKKLQQKTETQPKRKRKSSQAPGPPATASPDQDPSPAKRKKLVDSLEKSANLVANGNTERKSSKQRKKTPAAQIAEGRDSLSTFATSYNGRMPVSASPAPSTVSQISKGRLKRSDGSISSRGAKVGFFKPHEVEALEAFKVEFCNTNGCTAMIFDLMVQHGKAGQFPTPNGVTKMNFWKQMRDVLPDRDRRSIYRFAKRHFLIPGQKPHEWTEEQDDELVMMYRQYGPKWVFIGEQLGRGGDDVVQRWKNHLEHRNTMTMGPWEASDEEALKAAMRSVWEKLRTGGYDVGKHPYEMDESLISWGQVSTLMEHRRSRQQCADKWRRLRQAFNDPKSNSRANSASKSRSATPISARKGPNKSTLALSDKIVISDDSESDDESEKEMNEQPGVSAESNPPKGLLNAQETLDTSTSSDSGSGSDSESGEDDETRAAAGPKSSKATKLTNGTRQSSSSDASEKESDDESASRSMTRTVAVKKESVTDSSTSSDSESTSDDESGSESDEESAPGSRSKDIVKESAHLGHVPIKKEESESERESSGSTRSSPKSPSSTAHIRKRDIPADDSSDEDSAGSESE
ncbi:hypothetical protein BJY04DRAFT_64183 [Aspergillus karnatakaensis]|uniref:MYB DNA-binding domain protein n=1 Tax=Aspergillus karnatakaensis TaxID=1810916 RepID=UPI003CCCFCC5